MENKFKLINSLKQEIDELLPTPKWNDEFLEKVKLDFTFYTNKIENNAFTYGQTLSFLKDAVTPKNVSLRDCLDIQNHYDILDIIFKNHHKELSSELILNLHSNLMKDKRQWNYPDDYSPGKYKWDTNYTLRGEGKVHYYMSHQMVPEAISYLVEDVNYQLKNVDFSDINKHHLL